MLTDALIKAYHIHEIPLFCGLSQNLFDALMFYLAPLEAKCGETIYQEGEFNTDVYFVISGRVRIAQVGNTIKELGRGGICGGSSIKPAQSSATAIRDSFLLKLSMPAIEVLIQKNPQEFFPFIQTILIAPLTIDEKENVTRFKDFFVYVDVHDEFTKNLVASFKRELERYGTTVVINQESVFAHERNLDSWLIKQEMNHAFIIYEADQTDFPWMERFIKQSDRILFFCRSFNRMNPDLENIYNQALRYGKVADLILIHSAAAEYPSDTQKWLKKLPGINWHHIRENVLEDLQRIARIISGNAISLVLGGGGARGLAHIGLYKALRELKIPVDWIGGSCSGSIISGVIAKQVSIEEMIGYAKQHGPGRFRNVLDFTIPVISVMSGMKINHMLKSIFGNLQIEDLWINYFSVATNLTKSRIETIRMGSLWKAIRASISIPVALPPMTNEEGDILIDGAVINNLPVDIMKNFIYQGKVIAANFQGRPLSPTNFDSTSFGFWRSFKSFILNDHPKLNLFKMLERTTMLASRRHSEEYSKEADFFISYEIPHVGYFQFQEVERLVELGYRQAMERADELCELKKMRFVPGS